MSRAGAPVWPEAVLPGASRALQCASLGLVPYQVALARQVELVQQRRAQLIPDQLLLLQHPHVITLGTAASSNHVLLDAGERALLGIELFETGRGGDVTYHGPGQLVGYPIIDLKPDRCDLHRYVRDIEAALLDALRELGIAAQRKEGLTGVWVGANKIAAIGVRVSSGWITSHGFALNVNTDLAFFDAIVPCGIRNHGVTSIARETGGSPDWDVVERIVATHFARVFDRKLMLTDSANTTRKT